MIFNDVCKSRPMSEEDMKTIYKAFQERKSCNHDRDLLVMHLIMNTGCRPGEVLKSKVEEFHLDQGLWYVPGFNEKTGQNKRYFISQATALLIKDYLVKFAKNITRSGGYLIFSRKKGPLSIGHFGTYVYTPVIKRIGLWEEIPGQKTHKNLNKLYSIRGGVFISLHKKGYSLEEIKTLSQHASVVTLERWYLRYNQEATQKRLIKDLALVTQ